MTFDPDLHTAPFGHGPRCEPGDEEHSGRCYCRDNLRDGRKVTEAGDLVVAAVADTFRQFGLQDMADPEEFARALRGVLADRLHTS